MSQILYWFCSDRWTDMGLPLYEIHLRSPSIIHVLVGGFYRFQQASCPSVCNKLNCPTCSRPQGSLWRFSMTSALECKCVCVFKSCIELKRNLRSLCSHRHSWILASAPSTFILTYIPDGAVTNTALKPTHVQSYPGQLFVSLLQETEA